MRMVKMRRRRRGRKRKQMEGTHLKEPQTKK
jgi:hypothetical protein